MSSSVLLFAGLVFFVLVIFVIKLIRPADPYRKFPYSRKQALFSPAERSFLGALDAAVGTDYRIFAKVRVADIVEPKKKLGKSAWQAAFNRINAKHFDYVLCNRRDLSVICVVELDDQSHQKPKRKTRDTFLVSVCEAIDLPLVQIPAQRTYSVTEIKTRIMEAVGQGNIPVILADAIQGTGSRLEPTLNLDSIDESLLADAAPACPECGAPMVRRQVKTGSNTGKKFWGCSTYPKCRGVRDEIRR